MRRIFTAWILAAFLAAHAAASGAPEAGKRNTDISISTTTGWTTTVVETAETIELSADNQAIVSMSEGAFLYIRSRTGLTELVLEAVPVGGEPPNIRLWVRGIEKRITPRDDETIGDLLQEAAAYGVGAPSAMRRLYGSGGIGEALSVLDGIRSGSALSFAISRFAEQRTYGTDEYRSIIRSAGLVPGSSDLRDLLVNLGYTVPREDVLTAALMTAAGGIPSGADAARTVTTLARERGVGAEAALAMAGTAAGIPSSSDSASVLVVLAELMPEDDAVFFAYFDAVGSIPSSSEKRRALGAVNGREMGEQAESVFIETAKTIPSSSDTAAVLTEFILRRPMKNTTALAYLDAVKTIASSSDASYALNVLIDRIGEAPFQDTEILEAAARTTSAISSSTDKSVCLANLASIMRGTRPKVFQAYMQAVGDIPSSSDQERALRALLAVPGLDGTAIDDIERFTAERVSSRKSQENIFAEIRSLR